MRVFRGQYGKGFLFVCASVSPIVLTGCPEKKVEEPTAETPVSPEQGAAAEAVMPAGAPAPVATPAPMETPPPAAEPAPVP